METAATQVRATGRFSSARYLERLMAEIDRAAISTRLQQARETAGLTQPEMADTLQVHFRTIQEWESPKRRVVPFDRLEEWAAVTGTSRQWLLHGDQATQPGQDELAGQLARIEAEVVALRREMAEALRRMDDQDQASSRE